MGEIETDRQHLLRLLEEQRQQLSAVSSERDNEVARRTLELSKVVEEREQRLVALQAQSKHEVEAANAPAQVAMKERDDLKAELERGERERLNLTHDIGHGIMRKYGLEICRQCYRESAANIGFENVRRLVRQRIYVLFWRSNEVLRCLLLFASFSFLSVFMNCAS